MTDETSRATAFAMLVMLATPLLFSTNLIFGRAVIGDVAPFTLAFIRWALVALVLAPFLLRERQMLLTVMTARPGLVATLSFLGMVVCGAGVYLALTSTTATNGTLIMTSSSVFIILIEAAFFGRAIGVREAIGSAIAFAGVAVIVLKGDLTALLRLDFHWGDVLFVAAAFCWAVYSILYRSQDLRGVSNLGLFGVVAAVATLMLAPIAAIEFTLGGSMPDQPSDWISIAGIVVFASLLAFSGFQYGVRALGASLAGIFMYLMPPFAVTMAVVFLGETFLPFHAAGIALVMGGVILATFPSRTKKAQPSVPSAGNVSSSQ